jgi:hypothetical protein
MDRAVLHGARARKHEEARARILLALKWMWPVLIPVGVGLYMNSLAFFFMSALLVALATSLFWLFGVIKPNTHRPSGKM